MFNHYSSSPPVDPGSTSAFDEAYPPVERIVTNARIARPGNIKSGLYPAER